MRYPRTDRGSPRRNSMSDSTAQQLRQQIAELVGRYAELQMAPKPFVAGQSLVPPSGKVIGAGELQSMTEAVLDGWLTTGRFNAAVEKRLAEKPVRPFFLFST